MNQPNVAKNPHAIVSIGGIVWDSWEQPRLFKSVTVDLVTNESSEATIEFFDPKFRVIDSFSTADGIAPAVVKIYLGYGQDLGEPVFKGILAQIQRGASASSFIAFDMGFKMKLQKKPGYHNKKNDLDILKDLAVRNGLMFEGPKPALKLEPHQAMMQDEQTDWEHAMERARDAGLLLFVRQDTLFAKYPAKIETPVLRLENRKDFTLLNSFDFKYRTPEHLDGRPRIIKSRRRGKGGKRLEGKSDESNGTRERIVLKRDISRPSKSKLSKRAQAQKDLEREHSFEGHLNCLLPPKGTLLDVRNTVEIENIGKLFSGSYICDTVNFSFAAGELSLQLDLYRDARI